MRMKHKPVSPARRRAVNVSLEVETVAAAKDYGINISQACQRALAAEVKQERERRWKEEHQTLFDEWNRWTEVNGLPLAELRQF